ncbi:hypothetical protein EPUS_06936 [Endocarpon pusillum Z07020]|uniref:Uncharacterized protein n=1 Tax=Endocarpon pusillum (strain Z07020 / HMAS-L-300199) TaxID=1263415 RepID=U1HDQ1_ENDPU|nr:uncharacterized protein EPUS_06936 [Endocarpon pusillum Z07020]ERF68125.1 hypothetical protein EPUS_06936 [Endocarpon pusillum Z07020]
MSELLTGSADRRRPTRQPTREVAGEVTKKIIGLNNQALPPPAFSSPKIGGAARFLPQEELDMEPVKDHGEGEGDFREGCGISATDFTSSASSKPSLPESEPEHPLAAPPGWRRYWGLLDWEDRNRPDIISSPFCKHCYDDGVAWACKLDRWSGCKVSHPGRCLYVISYQQHPKEDVSINDLPEYRMRRHAREWRASVGTPLEIPTAKTERSLFIRAPSIPEQGTVKAEATGHEPIVPESRPTYSQVRSAYEDITRENKQNKALRAHFNMPRPALFPDKPSMPTWVEDVERFQPGDDMRRPWSRAMMSIPFKSGTKAATVEALTLEDESE